MGFWEKAKNYVKDAFEKYGDVANPGGFVGRPAEPAEAKKAEPEKVDPAKAELAEKLRGVKKEEKKSSYMDEVKEMYGRFGANPGGMIEKPMEKAEPPKKAEKAVAAAVAAQKRQGR